MKIAHWFFAMMFFATGVAQAQKGPLPPNPHPRPPGAAWPQNFNVAVNVPAKFSIAVDKPSQIVVTAQFTGSPISIALVHPNGQRTAMVANTSPARHEAPVAANEAKPGMTWGLEISMAPPNLALPRPGMPPTPRPSPNPTASGTVSVAINPPIRVMGNNLPPPPPPQVVPVITSLSKNPVKPGEELIINGRGFGSGQNGTGEIMITASPTDQVSTKSVRTLEWTDTRIRIIVPVYDGRNDHLVGLKTRWYPASGNWAESALVPLTIQHPPIQNCYGYHTRGDAAWQIACHPDAASCNANRASYVAKYPVVEALACAEEIYCYSFGDRVNNGPFGYKLNSCFSTTAACEADRKGRIIIIGGKDSSCSRSMHSGPPGHD
jgi:hypothetical protein